MFFLFLVTFLFPILGIELITFYVIANQKRNFTPKLKFLAFPCAIFFATFGYAMTFFSGTSTDLTRYWEQIELIRKLGISLSWYWKHDLEFLYTRDTLFWFVAKMTDVHILCYIVGFGIYYITFYVLFDFVLRSKKIFSIKEVFMLSVIAAGIIAPTSPIGNVRCVFSFVLIAFAAYRDLIQKKKNILTLLLYIIPIGLHISAIVVLFLRIIRPFSKIFGKYLVLVAFAVPMLIDLAYGILGGVGGPVGNAVSKAYSYLHWTSGGWADDIKNSLSDRLSRIYGSFFLITLTILAFLSREKTSDNKTKFVLDEPMANYIYLILTCALGCLAIVTGAFWRFEAVVAFFSPIILVPVLESKKKIVHEIFFLLFFSACCMILLNSIQISRNIDVKETAKNYIAFSGGTVLFHFFRIFNVY